METESYVFGEEKDDSKVKLESGKVPGKKVKESWSPFLSLISASPIQSDLVIRGPNKGTLLPNQNGLQGTAHIKDGYGNLLTTTAHTGTSLKRFENLVSNLFKHKQASETFRFSSRPGRRRRRRKRKSALKANSRIPRASDGFVLTL